MSNIKRDQIITGYCQKINGSYYLTRENATPILLKMPFGVAIPNTVISPQTRDKFVADIYKKFENKRITVLGHLADIPNPLLVPLSMNHIDIYS